MSAKIIDSLSNRCLHFFHQVSNVRPIVWIGLYVGVTPIFGLIYWLLPEGQFRIPDEVTMSYGQCLYYSIVTITTLGFGDYTPTHALSQGVTACEVMCGLIVLGLFLNAVGSMKSEIDVTSALEKQRRLHYEAERDKLKQNIPIILVHLNNFLNYCYLATTPAERRPGTADAYNADFSDEDLAVSVSAQARTGSYRHSDINGVLVSATRASLYLDSVQNRVDITLWPELLNDFFTFVAGEQMFNSAEASKLPSLFKDARAGQGQTEPNDAALSELADFIRKNAAAALNIEKALTEIDRADS